MRKNENAAIWVYSILLLLVFCAGISLFAFYRLAEALNAYSYSEEIYEEVLEAVTLPESTEPDAVQLPEIDWEMLCEMNPDITGWLYCTNTPINYPVVQGVDNEYYLTHLFDRREGAYGTLFVDSQCSSAGKNTIIYGHHMKNGTMLASITKYGQPSYPQTHPKLYLIQPNRTWEVQVFAGFTTAPNSEAYRLELEGDSFRPWLESMMERSDFRSEVQPESIHRVLTLSTCTYDYADARYVLMGSLVPIINK